MDDIQFRQLLAFLGYSWNGYRKVRKGVKKRIRRHMRGLGCQDMTAYLNLLKTQAGSRGECELLMTVPISRFFRDRQLWLMLENRWLPDIISSGNSKVAVWSAGCACGEEVYSFKIIWEQLGNRVDSLPQLEILATDRHPQRIERARKATYNRSSLREVGSDLRTRYFNPVRGSKQSAVKEELKSNIQWEIRDLMTEPPDATFHIIFWRNNILTYCRQADQISAFLSILNCLAPGGFFIIGCHESLPCETKELVSLAECPFIYKKDA
jgi:chemotaxis methyl-accepting protein methylase